MGRAPAGASGSHCAVKEADWAIQRPFQPKTYVIELLSKWSGLKTQTQETCAHSRKLGMLWKPQMAPEIVGGWREGGDPCDPLTSQSDISNFVLFLKIAVARRVFCVVPH